MKLKTQSQSEKLLTVKELGSLLKNPKGLARGRGYVHAMKKEGFKMPGKRATLTDALDWLSRNPGFSWSRTYRTRCYRPL